MLKRVPLPLRLRRGLVAYWPLADGSAADLQSALYDGSGPYDLTNNNTVTRGAGPSANLPDAANFVGASSQYFSIANANAPQFNWGDLTIAFWGNPGAAAAAGERWITKWGAAGNRTFLIDVNGVTQSLRVIATQDGSTTATATVTTGDTTNAWGLRVVRYRTSSGLLRAELWNVASAEASFASGGNLFTSTADLAIGALSGGGTVFLTGLMTQVLVSTVWLPDSHIDWLYNNGNGRDLLRGI